MLLPDRTNSNLHASPLVLQVSLCRLHPKVKITAPASCDKKDYVGNVLLALVLLREAKGETTLYVKKGEKFSSRLMIPESPRVAWLSVSSERCAVRRFRSPLNEISRRWSGDVLDLASECQGKSLRAESKMVMVHNPEYILHFLLRQEWSRDVA